MKKIILSLCVILTAVLLLTGVAAAPAAADIVYETYLNARFGYSAELPDIFDASREPDNGDGIWFETAGEEYTLTISGGHNIFGHDGDALLQEAYGRVAYIVEGSDRSGPNFYSIAYEGGGGMDGGEYVFHEYGIVDEDLWASFTLKYPKEEEERFVPIKERMEASLKLP
jgi:hypothetical protein